MAKRAFVIVLAVQKGGPGKSALTRHLAIEWMRRGFRVHVLDADKQGSTYGWFLTGQSRNQILPMVHPVGDEVEEVIGTMRDSADIILVDTHGRLDARVARALQGCDLALMPFEPDTDNSRALPATFTVLKAVQQVRPHVQGLLVVTKKKRNSRLMRDICAAVRKSSPVPVADTELHVYEGYSVAGAIGTGITTHEAKSIGAGELRALADEIERRFSDVFPTLPEVPATIIDSEDERSALDVLQGVSHG